MNLHARTCSGKGCIQTWRLTEPQTGFACNKVAYADLRMGYVRSCKCHLAYRLSCRAVAFTDGNAAIGLLHEPGLITVQCWGNVIAIIGAETPLSGTEPKVEIRRVTG